MILLVPVLFSCNTEPGKDKMERWKQEIADTELSFAEMAEEVGISEAFLSYAAEDAVLMRNNKLVIGKENLKVLFENQASKPQDEKLRWKPDFVDVSMSGDLGYTYGQFTYSYTDSTGTSIESTGVFHTVWKRQADGEWRFVWD